MYLRTLQEEQELSMLAPYALKNADSKGRVHPEKQDEYRLDFARDRDRILHTKAFRRLKGKTQVFVAHYGDHYRSRLTHSLEVAQVARTIARVLRLNEDIVEAVALAHDLGHTPFGHAGQDILDKKMKQVGLCFEHNAQSRRILETLEPKNLCIETLQCLCKHPTRSEKKEYNLSEQNYAEGQVVDIADFIAYTCHDVQDSVASGILSSRDFSYLPSNLLDTLIRDIASQGYRILEPYTNAEEIRTRSKGIFCFSESITPVIKQLKKDFQEKLYSHPLVEEQRIRGEKIISEIFDFLSAYPKHLPESFEPTQAKEIRIRDFIAGMTDSFAEEFWNTHVQKLTCS